MAMSAELIRRIDRLEEQIESLIIQDDLWRGEIARLEDMVKRLKTRVKKLEGDNK
jgi:predicted nuclease with TOPRIM domain